MAFTCLCGSQKSLAAERAEKAQETTFVDFDLAAGVSSDYTSNLFHEQNRRVDDFDTRDGEGERFEGMEGPWDVVTTPGLKSALSFEVAHRRKLKFELGVSYAAHARNPRANYVLVTPEASYDLTRNDTISTAISITPDRFKKNYAFTERLGERVFTRADYFQGDSELSYRRKWSKRLQTELSLGFGARRFDDPFANRDENRYRMAPSVSAKLGKRFRLGGSVTLAYTATPDGPELGVAVDRSRVDIEPEILAAVDLPRRFAIELDLGARFRRYLTDVPEDDSHFHRNDRRLTVAGEVSKRLGKGFRVRLGGALKDNNADRTVPEENDEFDYREVIVGGGIEYAFL